MTNFAASSLRQILPANVNDLLTDRAVGRIEQYLPRLSGSGLDSSRTVAAAHILTEDPALAGWLAKVLDRLSEKPLEKFIDNFLGGMVLEGHKKRKEATDAGYDLPMTLVLNPTMRCNLRCTGCYAFNFTKNADMKKETLQNVLQQARELGIRLITLTGGEPLLYPHLDELLEEFSDLTFLMYTNATFIDAQRAKQLTALGNVLPAISVEGFEEETDARRGKGVYAKVLQAMEHLRNEGVMFGMSITPTRGNTDMLATDEFLDYYLDKGVLFAWLFNYVPVGLAPDKDLMPTPEQRDKMRRAVIRWRKDRPIFLGDFWNDGPCVGGCMSASKYCYITATGDVQPCTFVHFATHNINTHTLKEIFQSPLFSRIRDVQPYSTNLLRPCKVIDHPEILREIVDETGAHETCEGARTVLDDPVLRAFLDDYSDRWAKIADKVWETEYDSGRAVKIPFFGTVNLWETYAFRMRRAQEAMARRSKSVA